MLSFTFHVFLLITILFFSTPCQSIKILIGNDDSWGTANIRALYNVVKSQGHEVILAAPANQQSGTNGLRKPATKLYEKSTFGILPAGSPAYGHDENADHIWYINSTPASSIEYGLNVLCPRYFKGDPDLVIAGTNQGLNVGLAYLGSGTFGAAKFAVQHRNIPSIAFSSENTLERPYTELGNEEDQANVYAFMAMDLIKELIENKHDHLLPPGTLLNVNFPDQTKLDCQASSSHWVLTRMLPSLDKSPDVCTNCDHSSNYCKLPTESKVFLHEEHDCTNSISVAVPNLNPDATSSQQDIVYKKLRNILSCLTTSPSLQFQQ